MSEIFQTDYEDNFGYYNIQGDLQEFGFLQWIRARSHTRQCVRCNRTVKLLPEVMKCATCSEWEEFGGDKTK